MVSLGPHRLRDPSSGASNPLGEVTCSWNPIVGCLHNCTYCWSRRYAVRLASKGIEPYKSHGFNPTFVAERLKQRLPDGKLIFVCVTKDTLVNTVDGPLEAKNIETGDVVLGLCGDLIVPSLITAKIIVRTKVNYRLIIDSTEIICSPTHRVLTPRGYTMARDLKVGDHICVYHGDQNNSKAIFWSRGASLQLEGVNSGLFVRGTGRVCWERIRGIEVESSKEVLYDLTTTTHNYISNRIVSHNCDMGDMWGCYDEETEVLTYNGWRRFSEVTYNDLIACLDPLNDKVIYCKPTRVIKYWYKGKMVKIKSNLIDLLVTPDHNLYVSLESTTRNRGWDAELRGFSLIKAEDCIGRRIKFRRDFPNWEGYEVNEFAGVPINAFMKFLGYYLAKGVSSVTGEPRIEIAQKSTGPHYKDILGTMMVVAESRGRDVRAYEDRIVIYGDRELTEYLYRLGDRDEKYIPPEIKGLSKRLLNMMLKAYISCNERGLSGDCKKAYTTSRRLADDIQEVALKCGYTSMVRSRSKKRDRIIIEETMAKERDYYEVIISRRDKTTVINCTRNTGITNRLSAGTKCYTGYEDYEGYVYCLEVPTHIIYVRRNGKPIWCGNSWVPRDWIESVLRVARSKPRSRFLFLTKNPARYLEFIDKFSDNVILGATIETNRDYGLSRAPPPRERYEAMLRLEWEQKAVFIEPILDFDEEFIDWVREIRPCMVYVGYDNYGNKLPEPDLAKTEILLRALVGITDLRLGTLRRAWYERQSRWP